MIHDHFTYAIVLMYVVEIIDAMSFAYYNLIKVDAFYAKSNTMTLSLLLTSIYPYWISPASTFCTHGAIVKVVAGDPQSEAVFGYFYPTDGGAREE